MNNRLRIRYSGAVSHDGGILPVHAHTPNRRELDRVQKSEKGRRAANEIVYYRGMFCGRSSLRLGHKQSGHGDHEMGSPYNRGKVMMR